MTDDIDGTTGFETHIKPLFRERDRTAMQSQFDPLVPRRRQPARGRHPGASRRLHAV